ncbi:putative C6 transcription factor [Talaromyces proteolyticus]|uniref:C6 transcription factor n=1 Tax=Talaromyces proteolyticus TaxID=1131652 RepID=A0AAD4KVW2_9EURO|nr:putative C6 transcription factor [Talaromyces proteolyticus]KAH8700951.1 putative C6 transcription factor [Talaromyces proteolyticus]
MEELEHEEEEEEEEEEDVAHDKDVAHEEGVVGEEEAVATTGVKKRWRRNRVACDACHARRVRCDRAFPCSRCVGSSIRCELTRERRKRGRIPRNDASRANSSFVRETPRADYGVGNGQRKPEPHQQDFISVVTNPPLADQIPPTAHFSRSAPTSPDKRLEPSANSSGERQSRTENIQPSPKESGTGVAKAVEDWMSRSNGFQQAPYPYPIFGDIGLADGLFDLPLEMFGMNDINGYQVSRSASRQRMSNGQTPRAQEVPLKYPVLAPLMPFIEPYLSRTLVYDLIDLYFTSAFSTIMHPVCHHIHCYVVRKASFLSRESPRNSSPALISSMLWVAALDDRAFSLSISPQKRKKLCRFLCALTVRLLRPLIHVSFKDDDTVPIIENDHSFPNPAYDNTQYFGEGGDDRGLVGPAGSLDDVITYMHIASIVSASEQKAASMRWWHAAFTLARELRLNQEVEVTPSLESPVESSSRPFEFAEGTGRATGSNGAHADYFSQPGRLSLNCICTTPHRPNLMTEEHREERRRAWWLLYIMDRHLALCYNRPLALLDAECEELLLPLDEGPWQAGEVHSNSPKPDGPQCLVTGDKTKRRCFPNFACNNHSVFGFFLPLMTITGELINLNQAKNHPILGMRLQGKEAWDVQVNEVLRQLDTYKATLHAFASQHPSPPAPPPRHALATQQNGVSPSILSEGVNIDENNLTSYHSWHTQTVIAYASYVVHVLHILLMGKWDPVALLEDKDFWTSSPTFASTISHALEAANALEQILHYDPDVSFMPYFFGIQLLQGSFLLLLIVERLQKEAGEGILKACEVVIRATESCVVTLNTEYQRNFRQVMRSAVAQARGRPVNHSEIRHRRKAVLALYRWTRNGTGLAL